MAHAWKLPSKTAPTRPNARKKVRGKKKKKNGKVQSVTLEHGMKLWSHRSLASYWKLAIHFASLPHDRWIQRILFFFFDFAPACLSAAHLGRRMWNQHYWIQRIQRCMPDGRHSAGRHLQNFMRKSVMYWTCWWMPSDKLVSFWTLGRQKFWRRRANTQQNLYHLGQPRTWFGTPPPSCIQGFLRKQINFIWQECVHFTTTSIFWRYDYTICLFCKWPSQNLQTGPSQVGRQIPQTRARHCGPSWRLRLVCSMAPHPSRVERTRFGMCWTSWTSKTVLATERSAVKKARRKKKKKTSWCQIMVPEMPGTTLEISKLHCQPFR